jgi:hypothetical protein
LTRTALQIIVEDSPPGPFMVRRLTQEAILEDRGISRAEVARRMGLTKAAMSLYFRGTLWRSDDEEAQARDHEDDIERVIEEISAEREFTVPRACRIVGPPDASGLPDVEFIDPWVQTRITEELMQP